MLILDHFVEGRHPLPLFEVKMACLKLFVPVDYFEGISKLSEYHNIIYVNFKSGQGALLHCCFAVFSGTI